MSEQFVSIVNATERQAVAEAALVLTAVGIDNFIEKDVASEQATWFLYVGATQHAAAHKQLELYFAENQPSPIKPVEAEIIDSGWTGVLAYLTIIWAVPALQSYTHLNFLEAGRMQAGLVMQGEWWRAFTAITLHGDIAHIASNSMFGIAFGLFVGRYLGSGLGWLLIVICGAFANFANALVQPDNFRSIGASTATFACLGLVPAFGWRRGFFLGRGWKRGFAPIFAAIAILSFTGFGAENVDALGHIFGFAAGIGMGLCVAHIKLDKISSADQQRAGFFAVFLIVFAWITAL